MDYFLARYYSSTQGRFTSPDEFTGGPDELYTFVDDASNNPTFYADLRRPQSLNKYQYAFNNPWRYVDPDGHDPDETEPDPDPPQDVKRIPIPRGPGPTPAEAQQTIEALKRLWELPDPYLYPIRQTIGTSPDPTTEPVPIPPLVVPAPQPQAQPMPPPPPVQAKAHKSGKRKSTKKKHEEGTARKKRDYGGEKGDVVRRLPRRPPGGKTPKGGWPPKPPKPPTPESPKPAEPKPTPLPE